MAPIAAAAIARRAPGIITMSTVPVPLTPGVKTPH